MATPTNVATLYIELGASEPVSAETIEGALAPTLRADWKAFTHGSINYLTPTWGRVQDDAGNLLGYQVVDSAIAGDNAQEPYPYVTGFLWHLFAKDPPIDFGGARSRILGEPRQTLRDAGYRELQISLVPYGTRPSGYHNWPAMPPLPTVDAPAPVKKAEPWGWALLGLGALVAAMRHGR